MEKQIKFRLFHYYEEGPDPTDDSKKVLREKVASFGQIVDIEREEDIERGERLGAFYSDEEKDAIAEGSFRGPGAEELRSNAGLPGGQTGEGTVEPVDGEVPDISDMSSEEVAQIISEGNGGRGLNVNETIALAQNDAELAEKVLDAETIASESDPRAGVEKALEKIMSEGNS